MFHLANLKHIFYKALFGVLIKPNGPIIFVCFVIFFGYDITKKIEINVTDGGHFIYFFL